MKKADEIGMTTEAIQVRYEDNTREDFPIILSKECTSSTSFNSTKFNCTLSNIFVIFL